MRYMYCSEISPNIDLTAIIVNEDIREQIKKCKKFVAFYGYLHPGIKR